MSTVAIKTCDVCGIERALPIGPGWQIVRVFRAHPPVKKISAYDVCPTCVAGGVTLQVVAPGGALAVCRRLP
jgi:hypothetical protein